ncbi:MAG: hypothetical protein PHN55_15790 [Dysgonamonadaceae bacterium]|nr:hypothetical protein [Dysgonamonadaceae bacterium]
MNLKEQFEWYLKNQQDLVNRYNGKILVIKDKEIVGVYDSEDIALFEASKKFGLGNFLIQLCTPGNDAYTQTFHSRVAFA